MPPCPETAEELIEYLDAELDWLDHVALTDVDISTGNLSVLLRNDKRFVFSIEAAPNV